MCGIAGVITFNGQQVLLSQLKVMSDSLAHRGPDREGFWMNDSKSIGLAHRRLSIIDLSDKAIQPMHYLGRYSIVFNGEIYNYLELKEELLKFNYSFNSHSDTEVLLALYDKYGAEMLGKLDGMFAFALWDEKEQQLFCARDRFGEKPFYYFYENGNRFVFSSEMKALFKGNVPKSLNNHLIYNFLVHHLENNPFNKAETFYENIVSLEAAHYILIKQDRSLVKKRYWQLNISINYSIPFNDAEDKFKELFNLSIKRRLRSDVPVGSSLSGGIDSSVVVCSINRFREANSLTQNTFSARFHNPQKDEGSYMKKVINSTSVTPHEVWVDEQVLIDDLEKICYYQEEPFGGANLFAQWKVMQLAKQENITVLLDGQGADEILAGYVHYFRPYYTRLYLHNPKLLKKELKEYREVWKKKFDIDIRFKLNAIFPNLIQLPGNLRRQLITPSYCKFMSKDFLHAFKNESQPFTISNSLNQALLYSTIEYGLDRLLRFADRNAMAYGREVRLPFLFHELVEFVFTLPESYKINSGWTKYLLRKSMEERIPSEIAWRVNKLGYEVPQDDWMKHKRIMEKVKDSREFLIKEKILSQRFAHIAGDWMCLITAAFLRCN